MPNKITLIFHLKEDVTPELFGQKVMQACMYGTLREGEHIEVPNIKGQQEVKEGYIMFMGKKA